ncbi:ferritin family protein [Bradyrhizobium sp. Ash2021]|uniref:ferritin-like domain-containing protein n=1 Tax=Bradyrhizobium sp. Ash2021 TaxID=2954771 RepID=UPI002815EB5C|nr:ferritin family protein [Bradyrhizobium sp. Ash2021]WMT73358.1 ferritin family protein [Bradyrhizobium sp. Ash2021]
MRSEPLLTTVPPAPVRRLAELYAIAFDFAQKAAQRYGTLAERIDESFGSVRRVFEVLVTRERDRADSLTAACLGACGKRPDAADLRWTPIDLVPAAEISEVGNSGLSTPYTAWALAARHRQRAFVFWTYVIARAEDPVVRNTAEGFARDALSDGNLLRRERRLAWRAERKVAADENAAADGADEPASAALLESLLLRDIIAWSLGLTPAQRDRVLAMDRSRLPPYFLAAPEGTDVEPASGDIEQVKQRALRRAEQLSNMYLDDADSAHDQDSMELAQKLAAQSIMRLAGLRNIASAAQ